MAGKKLYGKFRIISTAWLHRNYQVLKKYGLDVDKAIRNVMIWNEYLKRKEVSWHIDTAGLAESFGVSKVHVKRIIYKFKKDFNNGTEF